MRHRAAFARAVITRPSLLLMDEPFGALDAITRLRMHDFLLGMWDQYRTTIIFVTHDIEEAVLLGNRVAVMAACRRHPGGHRHPDRPAPACRRCRYRVLPHRQAEDPGIADRMSRTGQPWPPDAGKPTGRPSGSYLNTALVLSGIICIALIALALDACIRGLLLLADPSRRG